MAFIFPRTIHQSSRLKKLINLKIRNNPISLLLLLDIVLDDFNFFYIFLIANQFDRSFS